MAWLILIQWTMQATEDQCAKCYPGGAAAILEQCLTDAAERLQRLALKAELPELTVGYVLRRSICEDPAQGPHHGFGSSRDDLHGSDRRRDRAAVDPYRRKSQQACSVVRRASPAERI